ncbi:dihydrolipoamide dehydrogenase [Salinicoccus sediminis]|uniref:Dihydrolipoyl dehydrogenase n=1 Tax=Salinicoccus sediminis TaxID=1432562 RepID=A0A0M2SRF2_9STAP|nr:dihydrolipoyl dehydrogenase [Salinicoccus sediminis]KKK35552.1 dihydrolipoamide dehydrogenase [Salinicoccus sediminis]
MAHEYDLVVLGGGTAGYVAAIKASQLGLRTAVVEKSRLGGTCLHKGCIPTKSMLKSAEVANTIRNAEDYGIESFIPSISMEKIQARKDEVVDRMHGGINQLMKKNKIDVFDGYGRILGPSIFSPMAGTVAVEDPEDDEAESEILINQNVLIATGSFPKELPFLPFDGNIVLSSDDMMTLDTVPGRMAVVGGGVIGLEFASLLADLGSEVTVMEAGDQIIPMEDKDIAGQLKKSLEEKGIEFITGISLSEDSVETSESDATFEINGESRTFDKVLVSIGRAPNVDDIGLPNTKIVRENGFIVTDEHYQTKDKNIYAVGDAIGNLQLAHVATREAIIAVEHMADRKPYLLDYKTVPRCIYTSPETASLGYTEKELKDAGLDYRTHKIPLAAIGKAVIAGDKKGFGKLIVDPGTKDILGVSIIGPGATELINEAALAKFLDASSLELGMSVHAHPSIGEVLMELGLDADGIAIHV